MGEFVTVPVGLGPTNRQSETLLTTVGLRYGLTEKSEIYTRATYRFDNSRFADSINDAMENRSSNAFQSHVVGINYRFLDDDKYPALIGFADIALFENTASSGTKLHSAKSGAVGFTTYRVIDPVVISMTAGYRPNLTRKVDSQEINPGDTLFINPSIAFAVNNEMTLTGGFGLNFTGADMLDGVKRGTRNTNADLQFGLAYAWDKNTTLRADARTEVLGESGFTVGLTLTRKFGQKQQQVKGE
ncbi:transporter [Agrobacterium salinitolerans]